jgi:transmembrane sensor
MRPGPEGDELTQAATRWLIALDSGQADRAEFEEWRSADPRRAAAFAQVLAIWEQTARLRVSQDRPEHVAQAGDYESLPDRSEHGLTRRRLLTGGGMALLAAGTVSGTFLLRGRNSIATRTGERRTVRLPDGSTAELNTDSLLSWRFDRNRAVWLERGEVALSVDAGSTAPFLFHAGDLQAILMAGRYNSRLYSDGPELTAFKGGAEVLRGAAQPTRLSPMHAVSDRGGQLRTAALSLTAADASAAWRRGEIVFNGMSLDRAVGEFNRYLERKLVIDDPAIGQTRLGGRFFVDDPDSFLRSLREGFDIEARREADRIVLHAA